MTEPTKKLDNVRARTKIIEHLVKTARENYKKIEEKFKESGFDWADLEKGVLIRSIDSLWVEHLDSMTYMRRGIGLRGYGQRDPLVEYKKEAYRLFNDLNSSIQKQVVYGVYKLGQLDQFATDEFRAPTLASRASSFSAPAKTMSEKQGGSDVVKEKMRNEAGEKVGRNDPCPCNSGKKYKKCCGK